MYICFLLNFNRLFHLNEKCGIIAGMQKKRSPVFDTQSLLDQIWKEFQLNDNSI